MGESEKRLRLFESLETFLNDLNGLFVSPTD